MNAIRTTLIDFNPNAHECPFCLGLASKEIPTHEFYRTHFPVAKENDKGLIPRFKPHDGTYEIEWLPKYFLWGTARVDPVGFFKLFGLELGRTYIWSYKFDRLLLIEGYSHHDGEEWSIVTNPRTEKKYEIVSWLWHISAPGKPPKRVNNVND